MNALFSRMLTMCLAAGWMVPALCLLRLVLSRCPRRYVVLLWGMVALRLLCPVTVKSRLSLVPRGLSSVPAALPLCAAWLTGVAIMPLWGGIRLYRLRRKLAEAVWWKENVWRCDHLPAPFVMGFVHPRIYLPSDLQPEDAALVLAHERAHIRRGDTVWKALAYVLLSVYWYHPLLWLAYWLFCQDVELACDEKVVSELTPAERRRYAGLMITCAAPNAPVPGFGSHGLKTRIHTVLCYRKPPRWATPVFLAVLVVASVCFLTDARPAYSPSVHSAADQFFQELTAIAAVIE